MNIEKMMENKKVLIIPVYSTRSYDTSEYDLLADGNISKVLMKIKNANAKFINILFPQNSKNTYFISEFTKNMKVRWIPAIYGKNAHETRNMGKEFLNVIKGLMQIIDYDLIISEIDALAYLIAINDYDYCKKENFIYWAGSWNADGTPWYEEGHDTINKTIAKEITTACLLPGQVNLYGGKSFYDECIYEPQYFDKKIIFFPFRLSDKSYHVEDFKNVINEIYNSGIKNFKVLYTDVNDSHLFDGENEDLFIKVNKNKFVYNAILKGKPIIVYLDDINKNYHSNIFEFIYYGCDIIMIKNDIIKNNSITYIEKVEEFKQILINKLEG